MLIRHYDREIYFYISIVSYCSLLFRRTYSLKGLSSSSPSRHRITESKLGMVSTSGLASSCGITSKSSSDSVEQTALHPSSSKSERLSRPGNGESLVSRISRSGATDGMEALFSALSENSLSSAA